MQTLRRRGCRSSRSFLGSLAVLAAIGLAGCAPKQKRVAAPPPPPPTATSKIVVASKIPPDVAMAAAVGVVKLDGTTQVTVFYGTDRKPTGLPDPNLIYGPDRGTLTYGEAVVTIPPHHVPGTLPRPAIWRFEFHEDPLKHVTVMTVVPKGETDFYADLQSAVNKAKTDSVMVFVHGYNTDFAEALRRTGQLAYDLGCAVPILYSWPSQGSVYQYFADKTQAKETVPNLITFLQDVHQRSGATAIFLVAHSMGGQVVSDALSTLAAPPGSGHLFAQVVLAAPDIDSQVFTNQLAAKVVANTDHATLYASSKDEVLALSAFINKYRPAGDSTAGILHIPGFISVDASAVDTGLGHSYLGDVRSVVEDIALLLLGKTPTERHLNHEGMAPSDYWAIAGH